MYQILQGLRVIEGASFVAGPICGEHLLELGAEVIRFDDIRGGLDARRWPVDANGTSLFWEGQNKGKKSIAIDLSRPEGRELVTRLITAPGENAGLFVTNFPVGGFLAHDVLKAHREDLITLRVMGWPDGRNAVDYTMNAVTGLPFMTGPKDLAEDHPVNHVLPAWDLITGAYSAFALLAAERQRRLTGQGAEIRVALTDIAATTIAHLGTVAEINAGAPTRPRIGNDLFGAFGRSFLTRDGAQVIIVAITARQWSGLVKTFGIGEAVARLETQLGASFAEEGARFIHREALFALVAPRVAELELGELATLLDSNGVCWEKYATLKEAVSEKRGLVQDNPIFAPKRHPSGLTYPTAGSPATFTGSTRADAPAAPRLGEHTAEILEQVLSLSSREIARLHDDRIVASAK